MKRTRRSKQTPTRQPNAPGKRGPAKPTTGPRELPPNEKVNKYADELYGDTEIPTRA